MKTSKFQMLAGISALLLIACQGNEQEAEEQGEAEEAQSAQSAPPALTYARVSQPAPADAAAPRAVTDLASAVSQTAAVIEGTVSELHYEFSDEDGPWTRIVLGDVQHHLGSASGKLGKLELRQFGGLLPNGRMMVAAELPIFVQGQRYLVFLRNTAWNLSPVVGSLALRVDAVGGTEVLVNTDGHPVVEVGPGGPGFGAALFEPIRYTGPAIVQKPGALAALPGKPLDRRAFLESLQVELDGQGLRAGGAFLEHPAGNFRWHGQAVTPHGQAQPAAGAGRADLDTSGPTR
jgi:hypothetical protein